MLKIGITGSLASGKSTVAKILSRGKYPLFSADKVVKELYSNKKFIKKITKIFNLKKKNFKIPRIRPASARGSRRPPGCSG